MDRLIIVEAGIEITEPETKRISKAYKFVPPQSEGMPNIPAWTNSFALTQYDINVSGQRVQTYTVQSQLFVAVGVDDVQADIAASFLAAFLTAMQLNSTLNDADGQPTITDHTIIGGNPTLASLGPLAGLSYIGLNLFIDLRMTDAVTIA